MHTQPTEHIPTPDVYDSDFGAFAEVEHQQTYHDRHRTLMVDFIDALAQDPARMIPTPAYLDPMTPAVDVMLELLGNSDDKTAAVALARAIGMAAAGQIGQQMHLQASAAVGSLAKQHADLQMGMAA